MNGRQIGKGERRTAPVSKGDRGPRHRVWGTRLGSQPLRRPERGEARSLSRRRRPAELIRSCLHQEQQSFSHLAAYRVRLSDLSWRSADLSLGPVSIFGVTLRLVRRQIAGGGSTGRAALSSRIVFAKVGRDYLPAVNVCAGVPAHPSSSSSAFASFRSGVSNPSVNQP